MKIPVRVPKGFIKIQPNRLFESKSEAVSFGAIHTWTDIESGKICCLTLIPEPKEIKNENMRLFKKSGG